jgi:hypothetical protein
MTSPQWLPPFLQLKLLRLLLLLLAVLALLLLLLPRARDSCDCSVVLTFVSISVFTPPDGIRASQSQVETILRSDTWATHDYQRHTATTNSARPATRWCRFFAELKDNASHWTGLSLVGCNNFDAPSSVADHKLKSTRWSIRLR